MSYKETGSECFIPYLAVLASTRKILKVSNYIYDISIQFVKKEWVVEGEIQFG